LAWSAGDQILPYLDPLATRLLHLLSSSEIDVREMVLPAISALAESAERAFLPYYPQTIELVKFMMSQVGNGVFVIYLLVSPFTTAHTLGTRIRTEMNY